MGIGKDTVARIWRDHNLKPWKVDDFKISTDPRFEDKLVDVVGLYLNPPERAVVFSFDEKTQCQALDRTQPSLPMKPGRAGTMTHDYKRHGTVDLFAALNVATGEVLYRHRKRHTGADVLAFFKLIDLHVPQALRGPRRAGQPLGAHGPRGHPLARPSKTGPLAPALHPDQLVWLNLVERWFTRAHRPSGYAAASSLASQASSRPSSSGPSTGTTTPSPSSGTRPPKRSSRIRRGRATLHQVKFHETGH